MGARAAFEDVGSEERVLFRFPARSVDGLTTLDDLQLLLDWVEGLVSSDCGRGDGAEDEILRLVPDGGTFRGAVRIGGSRDCCRPC